MSEEDKIMKILKNTTLDQSLNDIDKRLSALENKDYDRIEKILEQYDLQNNAIWHIINELLGISDIPEGFEPDFSDFIRETLSKNRIKKLEMDSDSISTIAITNADRCQELEEKLKELEQLLPKKIEIIKESLEKQCDKWFDKRDKDHIKDHLELEQKYTNISDIEAYNSVRIGQLKMVLREEIENRNSYLRTMLLLAPESLAEHHIKNVEETIKKGEKELEKIGSEDIIKDIVPGSMCKCGHIAWVHAEYTDWCSECDCTKFEKEPSESPAEDPNTIHGINIYCPNCGLTQRGVFTSGKELIAEFIDDLDIILETDGWGEHELAYTLQLKEKWEARKK